MRCVGRVHGRRARAGCCAQPRQRPARGRGHRVAHPPAGGRVDGQRAPGGGRAPASRHAKRQRCPSARPPPLSRRTRAGPRRAAGRRGGHRGSGTGADAGGVSRGATACTPPSPGPRAWSSRRPSARRLSRRRTTGGCWNRHALGGVLPRSNAAHAMATSSGGTAGGSTWKRRGAAPYPRRHGLHTSSAKRASVITSRRRLRRPSARRRSRQPTTGGRNLHLPQKYVTLCNVADVARPTGCRRGERQAGMTLREAPATLLRPAPRRSNAA